MPVEEPVVPESVKEVGLCHRGSGLGMGRERKQEGGDRRRERGMRWRRGKRETHCR